MAAADGNARDAQARVAPLGDLLSCVVYTQPGRGADVAHLVGALDGVQVHCGADIDKLVVTIEDMIDQPAADMLGALNRVAGVINTILVYHFGGHALAPRTAGGV